MTVGLQLALTILLPACQPFQPPSSTPITFPADSATEIPSAEKSEQPSQADTSWKQSKSASELPEGVSVYVRPMEQSVVAGKWTAFELEIVVPDQWVIFAFNQAPDVSIPSQVQLKPMDLKIYGAPLEPTALGRYERLFQSLKVKYFNRRLLAQQRVVVLPNARPGRRLVRGELTFMLGDDHAGKLLLVNRLPFELELKILSSVPPSENIGVSSIKPKPPKSEPAKVRATVAPDAQAEKTAVSKAAEVPKSFSSPPSKTEEPSSQAALHASASMDDPEALDSTEKTEFTLSDTEKVASAQVLSPTGRKPSQASVATTPSRNVWPPSLFVLSMGLANGVLFVMIGPRGPFAGGSLWRRTSAWSKSSCWMAMIVLGGLSGACFAAPLEAVTAGCVLAVVLGCLASAPGVASIRKRVNPIAAGFAASPISAAVVLWLATDGHSAWEFSAGSAAVFFLRSYFGSSSASSAQAFAYSWDDDYADTLKRRQSLNRAA